MSASPGNVATEPPPERPEVGMATIDEPDPEFEEDAGGIASKPTSHMRSREEYLRGLRETWQHWLPSVPVPPEWRDPDPAEPNPGSDSNNSEVRSDFEEEWPEPRRTQDRVRPQPHQPFEAPHSFRSRPPVEHQASEGYAIGVGYLVLTLRELNGLSQRVLARHAGTSQGAITRIETGAHTPSMPSIIRLATAAGYRVVLGLASPDIAGVDPAVLTLEDLALVGLLVPDPLDGLPNFRVLREPPPWAGRDLHGE
jgi:transcriptional regulator with XRE-family HTH domain